MSAGKSEAQWTPQRACDSRRCLYTQRRFDKQAFDGDERTGADDMPYRNNSNA